MSYFFLSFFAFLFIMSAKHSGELGEELWDAYPDYTISDGRRYSWKNIGKRFNSMEDFYYFYGKQINHNPEKHREVLDILN